jgi:hypothetical protein
MNYHWTLLQLAHKPNFIHTQAGTWNGNFVQFKTFEIDRLSRAKS